MSDDVLGDRALRNRFHSEYDMVAVGQVMNKFMIAILCFMAALGSNQWGLHFVGMTKVSFNVIIIPVSIIALIFVIATLRNRDITNSIILSLLSISQIINAISQLSFDSNDMVWIHIFFVIGFTTASYVFHYHKKIEQYPSIILALTFIISTFSIGSNHMVLIIGFTLAGLLYFVSATYRLYLYSIRMEDSSSSIMHFEDTTEEYNQTVINTLGVLSFSMMTLLLCYYSDNESLTLYTVKLIISVISLVFGLYAINNGLFTRGLFMFIGSLNMFLFALLYLLGFQLPMMMSLITSMMYLPLSYRFLRDKDYAMSIASISMFVLFCIEGLTILQDSIPIDRSFLLMLMDPFLTLAKVISCALPVAEWLKYETNINFPGIASLLLYKRVQTPEGVDRGRYGIMTAYLIMGILVLWIGLNYVGDNLYNNMNREGFLMVSIILSIPSMLYVRTFFRESMTSEGIMAFIISLSTFIFSLGQLVYDVTTPETMYFTFMFGTAVALISFMMNRDYIMASIAFSLIISYATKVFVGDPYSLDAGIAFTVTGTLLVFRSLSCIIFGVSGQQYLFAPDPRKLNDKSPVFALIPFLLFLVHLLSMLMYLEDDGYGFGIVGCTVSVTAIVVGIYCMAKGDIMTFPLILIVAIISITESAAYLMAIDPTYHIYIPIIVIGLIIGPVFLLMGRVLMGFTCIVCSAEWLIGCITGVWQIIWNGFGLFGFVAMAYCVSFWLAHERLKRPNPILGFSDLYWSIDDDDMSKIHSR